MKRKLIVPSNQPVTTVFVAGQPHHFFQSAALGLCEAIIITDDDPLPYPPESSKSADLLQKNTISRG